MDTPWKGEKVRPFIRGLAWIFILCAVFGYGLALYFLVTEWNPDAIETNLLDSAKGVFGILSSLYVFLLFVKVAVSGRAPKSWLPWD